MKVKLVAFLVLWGLIVSLCACGNIVNTVPSAATTVDEPPINDNSDSSITDPAESTGPTNTDGAESSGNSQSTDETMPSSGLIVMTVSPNQFGENKNVVISCIDINTGAQQTVSTFNYGRTSNEVEYQYRTPDVSYYATRREWFNQDYSKLAVTKVDYLTGETYAGWLDSDGNFTNVTEALGLQAKSDFDERAQYNAVGFADDVFVYHIFDQTGNMFRYFYVPIRNLTSSAAQEGLPFAGSNTDYYQIASSRLPITGIIDETHWIINGDSSQPISTIYNSETDEQVEYVPGDARYSWNGVVSPDGNMVAFVSCTKTWSQSDVYIMSLTGEAPVKVPVELSIAMQEDCERGYSTSNTPCNMLIGWC